MIRANLLLFLSLFCSPGHAAVPQTVDSLDLQAIEVSTVISLYLKEVSTRPYMLCDDVLTDTRKVSLRGSGKTLTGPLFASLLEEHGFTATDRGGVLYVCRKAATEDLADSFLYRVRHRDPVYLVDLLAPLVKGIFANKRVSTGALTVGGEKGKGPLAGEGAVTSSTFNATGDDYILFSGTAKEIGKLKNLLSQVDVPRGEVLIKAYMYEVGSNDTDASALGLMLSAIGGKFQVRAGGNPVENLIRLKTTSIDVIASALKSDGRFKVLASPYERVRSGATARFVSGSQVSVVGAILTNQNGSTQQSYDRVESGTILEISPVVRDQGVDLDLFQQVSSFVSIDGSSQPTLNKRELRTSLTVRDGEIVVIAGLDDLKQDDASSGLSFIPFPLSRSRSVRKSQLILVLEVSRVATGEPVRQAAADPTVTVQNLAR